MSGNNRTPLGAANAYTLKGYSPAGNSKVVPATVKLAPASGVQTVNLSALPGGNQVGSVTTIYVDNSGGPIPVQISYPDTGMMTEIPAYSQGFFPALTAGLVLQVSAPLIGVLGQPMTVTVQAANFALPQAAYGPFLPNANAGAAQSIGVNTGWTTETPNIIADGATNRLWTSLEIDATQYGGAVSIAGTGIDGGPWTARQMPLTKSEFVVPASVSGSALLATASIPLGGNTNAVLPVRWRVQPVGVQPSYGIPLYMPWNNFSWTALPVGTATQQAFPPEPGNGVYLDKILVTASGWSSQFNVSVVDTGFPGGWTLLNETFPGGNVAFSENLGYVSFARNAAINILVGNAAAATGVLMIGLRGAFLPASQNG